MAEPTTARPGIDPTMQALLEAFPFKFTADDGVEVAREQMRQLKTLPEALPDTDGGTGVAASAPEASAMPGTTGSELAPVDESTSGSGASAAWIRWPSSTT